MDSKVDAYDVLHLIKTPLIFKMQPLFYVTQRRRDISK